MPEILDKYYGVTLDPSDPSKMDPRTFPYTREGSAEAQQYARTLANQYLQQTYVVKVYEHN